jgi:general secretion pathway protein H
MLRTSAPGTCSRHGFTLIELLVVLLIMGLLVGAAVAIVRPDDRVLLRAESERLAQMLALAAEEVRLGGRPIAWTADRSGYRFWRMAEQPGLPALGSAAWVEILDNDLLRARTLPQGIAISRLLVEGVPVRGAMRLAFASDRAPLVFTVELSLGETQGAVAASPMGELRVLPVEGDPDGALASR